MAIVIDPQEKNGLKQSHPGYYMDASLKALKTVVMYKSPVDILSLGQPILTFSPGAVLGKIGLYVLRNGGSKVWFSVEDAKTNAHRGWIQYEPELLDETQLLESSSGKVHDKVIEDMKKKQNESVFETIGDGFESFKNNTSLGSAFAGIETVLSMLKWALPVVLVLWVLSFLKGK